MSTLKNNWVDGDQYTPAAANAVANTFPMSGAYASMPAAGYGGRVYYCTDVDSVYYDNGTSWVRIRAGKSGVGALGDVPASGWTAVNTINSATFAADRDGMLLTVPTNVTNAQITGWFRTLSPATNYTATTLLEVTGPTSSAWGAGLALRNSSSGSIVIFTVGINTGDDPTSAVMKASKWSSATAGAGGNYQLAGLRWMMGVPNWLRIRDNGTNRYLEYSFNGIDWFTFHSVSRTDYITPDQIGVVAECAGQAPIYARLRSLNGIS